MIDPGIGADTQRIDGIDKVTGRARYTADFGSPVMAHAMLVPSAIAKGRVVKIDTDAAECIAGVLLILTHETMEPLQPVRFYMAGGHAFQSLQPLQSDRIAYRGQTIAMIIAETLEAANEAAGKITTEYETDPFDVDFDANSFKSISQAEAIGLPIVADKVIGKADEILKTAEVVVDAEYRTPAHHHNPMELLATVAEWLGESLIVRESTQNAEGVRNGLAIQLGLDLDKVRVISPLIGGGFGQKAALGPHTAMAAVAARRLGRPVKLVIPRGQIFHAASFRAATRQRVRIGANRDGQMIAAIHEVVQQTSRHDLMPGLGTDITSRSYGIPNFRGDERLVKLDTQTPGFMRAPFEMASSFAFESAVDELAYALDQDPVDLRVRNDTQIDPISGKPFSSRDLVACLQQGAERFGWKLRSPEPRSMRAPDGSFIGMGVAIGSYKANTAPTFVRMRLTAEGSVTVSVAGHEMGQGLSTAITQAVADRLGVDLLSVTVLIGDTIAPPQHVTAGSWGTTTAVPAAYQTADNIRRSLVDLAVKARGGPLFGRNSDDLTLIDSAIVAPGGLRETIGDLLRRAERPFLESEGAFLAPGQSEQALERARQGLTAFHGPVYADFVSYSYAAHFVEVHVQPRTRRIRVARTVSAVDCGRVINPRTARSQVIGGMVWGIGAALRELSEVDTRYGGFLNTDIAEYAVPVNADVPKIDVLFIDKPDSKINVLGAKGLGEVAMVGAAAAIANAVHHATGRRMRRLPIRIDDLISGDPEKGTS